MFRTRAISAVISQHAEELASLWMVRDGLTTAGHAALRHLGRLDDRIAAHQDACLVAGADVMGLLNEQLGASPGSVFAAAVAAFDQNDRATVRRCLEVAEALPDAARELLSAIGWVSATRLTGIVKQMLDGSGAVRRIGLAACRLHGVDPGPVLTDSLNDSNPDLRAEAMRTVGVLGRVDLRGALLQHTHEHADCRFWAAWSAVLLGDRRTAIEVLVGEALSGTRHSARAAHLACMVASPASAPDVLHRLGTGGAGARIVIEASGLAGSPSYVPWLIQQMADEAVARAAGAAFSAITGVDIALLDLERLDVQGLGSGPNDDPADDIVESDPDEGLAWPEPVLVGAWWNKHGRDFQQAVRYFVGLPLTPEHAGLVLRDGTQRQRSWAAHHLCLLAPGTPLFNTSAPAWRQQRRLRPV